MDEGEQARPAAEATAQGATFTVEVDEMVSSPRAQASAA